jgi:uncharacterized protein with HEPN domain
MTAKRLYQDYVRDILDNAGKTQEFVAGLSMEKFRNDPKTIYAVIRALEVLGEAAKSIPENIRSRFPTIPWSEMTGMRDKLIHAYFGVNIETVWKTVTEDIPGIIGPLENLSRSVEAEENRGREIHRTPSIGCGTKTDDGRENRR